MAGCLCLGLWLCSPAQAALTPPAQDWFPKAPALPAAAGDVVEVSTVEGLVQAVEQARPGQTILVAEGHYLMPRYIEIQADRVTLRGASGRRERVILDGVRSMHGELVGVRGCSDVTIADLTIQNIRFNGFKINSDSQRPTADDPQLHHPQHLAAGRQGREGPRGEPRGRPPEGLPHPVLPVLQRPTQAIERRPGRHRRRATTSAGST